MNEAEGGDVGAGQGLGASRLELAVHNRRGDCP
jgi:hypothetical protein